MLHSILAAIHAERSAGKKHYVIHGNKLLHSTRVQLVKLGYTLRCEGIDLYITWK